MTVVSESMSAVCVLDIHVCVCMRERALEREGECLCIYVNGFSLDLTDIKMVYTTWAKDDVSIHTHTSISRELSEARVV